MNRHATSPSRHRPLPARLLLAVAAALLPVQLFAHSVGQRQTTKFLAPETVQMLVDRANGGSPGFVAGDVISYIIQFSPVANGATVGVAGYVTDYIPPNTEVVGASIVMPGGAGFVDVAPNLPGTIDNGWGRGQNTFLAPFNTNAYDTTGLCAAAGKTNNCNGSLAQLHADTGIFFSTDSRTTAFPAVPTRIQQGTNGYFINPTGLGQLWDIVGNPSQAQSTTHNLWDAAMSNAFGTNTLPAGSPRSSQAILTSDGRGGAPFGAGSPVAGPQTGFRLDYTGGTGPWQRIAYSGSRTGTTSTGPATAAAATLNEPAADALAIKGSPTSLGWSLSPSNPLPSNTNAVRWALGALVVGQTKYVRISIRLLATPPSTGIINGSEVWGGDAAGADDGKDNPWRYHVPSVADNNSNLYVLKKVVCVYSGATCVADDGASVPANAKIRYRVTYINTGNLPQTNVVLTDVLPSQTGTNSVSNAAIVSGPNILPFAPANPAAGGATITFQTIASLGPGAGGAVEYDVQTNAVNGDSVVNTARLVSTQIPSPGVTSSAVSAVQNAGTLAIAKTVTPASTSPGGTVTYTITVTNTGTAAVSSIVVDEFLPSDDGAGGSNNAATRFSFVAGSSTFTGFTAVTPALTTPTITAPYANLNRQQVRWNFGSQSLAANASFTISFQATVGASVPVRSAPYTNDARVTYNSILVETNNTAPVQVGSPASLTHVKTVQVVADPFNGAVNPKAIPGADMLYTLLITNTGGGVVDNNSMDVVDPVPANTRLFLGDLSGAGTGPVQFVNGTPSSGLAWTYTALGNGTDDLEFSLQTTGNDWSHTPSADGNGYDTSGTRRIRMRPKGTMAGNSGSGNPSFQLRFRVRIN